LVGFLLTLQSLKVFLLKLGVMTTHRPDRPVQVQAFKTIKLGN